MMQAQQNPSYESANSGVRFVRSAGMSPAVRALCARKGLEVRARALGIDPVSFIDWDQVSAAVRAAQKIKQDRYLQTRAAADRKSWLRAARKSGEKVALYLDQFRGPVSGLVDDLDVVRIAALAREAATSAFFARPELRDMEGS
jgi:hypothetical protein